MTKQKKISKPAKNKAGIYIRSNAELNNMVDDLQKKLPILEKRSAVIRYAVKRLHRQLVLNEIDPQ